jgi:hypothetical protein
LILEDYYGSFYVEQPHVAVAFHLYRLLEVQGFGDLALASELFGLLVVSSFSESFLVVADGGAEGLTAGHEMAALLG